MMRRPRLPVYVRICHLAVSSDDIGALDFVNVCDKRASVPTELTIAPVAA
jgi:hypothetical protein